MPLVFKQTSWVIFHLFISAQLFSQSNTVNKHLVNKNNLLVSVGYGSPSALRIYIRREEADKDLTVNGFGPLTVKIEYCPIKKVTIGINAFLNTSDVYWMQDAKNSNDIFEPFRHGVIVKERGIGLRINYYFRQTKKFNFYAGGGAGFGYINAETYTHAPKERIYINHTFPTPYNFEGTIGARYFFTKNFGLYSEIGIGQSWLLYNYYYIPAAIAQLGIAIKL